MPEVYLKPRNTLSEIAKRQNALNVTLSILPIFRNTCEHSRGSSFHCNRHCADAICDTHSEAVDYAVKFRQHLWVNPSEFARSTSCSTALGRVFNTLSGRDHRNVLLLNELFLMKSSAGNVDFCLGPKKVLHFDHLSVLNN